MACVDRYGAYCLVLTLLMFFNTVNGSAQTKVSCGESGGVVGQSQVLSCNISGSVENDIYWYRYNETYHENIIICLNQGGDVGTCLALEPSLYYVSSQPQQPKQQVFTIMSVTQEDLQVSWLCVDNNSFPERASIQAESTCRVDESLYF
ncbi:hypothetical protein SNE40_017408 [Patella caerulea]|uniref:Ig-like domain-containing protein n=1 Tax=Patella caerulea TaxID=87958 RepID=A0AAN8JF03_PATCE